MNADEWKLEFNKNGIEIFKSIKNPFNNQIKESPLDMMEYDKLIEKFENNNINMVVTKIERKIENDVLKSLIFYVSDFKFLDSSCVPNKEKITGKTELSPRRLIIGKDELSVRHSKDLLKSTADWLFKNGLLKNKDLPVYVPNGKRYLLNSKPVHEYGRPFDGKPHKISQDIYMFTNLSTVDCITLSKYLMNKFAPDIEFEILGFQ